MTEEQIIEGNKLIAEFLGEDHGYTDKGWLKSCRYHTSFDWLVPAVEGIEQIELPHHGKFSVHIYGNCCTIESSLFDPNASGSVYHATSILDTKIESTWAACVSFVKWHKSIL